jgi:hypothetical protein
MSHWLQAKDYGPEWKERHMSYKRKDETAILVVWGICVLFCLGINVAFLYLMWRLGWAAVAWLSK